MRRASWRCKLCRTWGVGGPTAAAEHLKTTHREPDKAASALVSFGFTPRPPARSRRHGGNGPVHVLNDVKLLEVFTTEEPFWPFGGVQVRR